MRVGLDYVVPHRLPFITFFPAILLSAYFCGLWPSVLVLVLSAATDTLRLDASTDSAVFHGTSFVLFLVIGGINVALVHHLLRALDRVRQQDLHLALVNRELKHRIKNLFSITNSICIQTIRSVLPAAEMSRSVSGRIMALAAAQDLLSLSASKGADLDQLIAALVTPMAPAAQRLVVTGPRVTLPIESTTPFAQILHELATNATSMELGAPRTGASRYSGRTSGTRSTSSGGSAMAWPSHRPCAKVSARR